MLHRYVTSLNWWLLIALENFDAKTSITSLSLEKQGCDCYLEDEHRSSPNELDDIIDLVALQPGLLYESAYMRGTLEKS